MTRKQNNFVPTFLTSITLSLGLIPNMALGESVAVFVDSAVPQLEFAAGDIQAALETKRFSVEIKALDSLTESHQGKKVILAFASNTKVAALMANQGGKAAPAPGNQAYALRTTTTPEMSYWVLGGDANGAMYGGLQVAENIQFDAFTGSYDEEESPYLKNRGIKFNIPLDKESPTYFYSSNGTSHKEALHHVWDLSFWTTWFDEMARHRYNVLSLWSPHPFTSMLKMADYPEVAIQGVQGFDAKDKAVPINDMTIDEKIAFWQKVMKHGRDRGFGIYFCTWNIFLSTAEGKYGITDSPRNLKTKDYLRACTKQFIETYPDLTGIGITVGEKMGGLNDGEKEEWAWEAYGKGVMEYAQAHPERELVFIHRHHDGNLDDIMEHFTPLNELPNVRLDLSFKYSQAHGHATVKPNYWDRKRMAAAVDRSGLKSWLTIRNDDFYFLHWADPQFVRDYVKNFPEVGKYVDSVYIGPDGWVFTRDFASKNPFYGEKKALSIQKTWYMQKLWGRISYNPSVSDDLFMNHLSLKYPEASTEVLFEAWSSASRAIQLANEQVTGTWDLDFHWWPESWSSKDGYRSLKDMQGVKPMDGSNLCSFEETARGDYDGKTSAFTTADTIEELANRALEKLSTIESGSNTELKLNLQDLTAMSHLSLYSAHKFRAAIHLEQGKRAEARDAMAAACVFWGKYTNLMDQLYQGAEMQRVKGFTDWHAYDQDALKDYTDLGGEGR